MVTSTAYFSEGFTIEHKIVKEKITDKTNLEVISIFKLNIIVKFKYKPARLVSEMDKVK